MAAAISYTTPIIIVHLLLAATNTVGEPRPYAL
jgi:hypothetical protein